MDFESASESTTFRFGKLSRWVVTDDGIGTWCEFEPSNYSKLTMNLPAVEEKDLSDSRLLVSPLGLVSAVETMNRA